MEVKDLRLVESEEGKWTKVRWQLRKDKVVSVDKEESMVVESVRSSEQLVRWRVVRWRNGVAVSQVVVVEVVVHGSWVVGMYRLWSAWSCFGSSVVVDGGDVVVVVVMWRRRRRRIKVVVVKDLILEVCVCESVCVWRVLKFVSERKEDFLLSVMACDMG
ncbi:hypothetical protein Tco_1569198 [Tanacetum coccineum]